MRKYTIVSILLASMMLLGLNTSFAQQQDLVEKTRAVRFEVDVISAIQGGFGFMGGYHFGKNRIDFDMLTNPLAPSYLNIHSKIKASF